MAKPPPVASVRRAESRLARLLAGRRCYGGLDLASRLDTTAFALCFPPDPDEALPAWLRDRYAILCWHWLPETVGNERRDKVPYLVWRDQGWLTLTPGNVCDYETIENDVVALKDQYRIQEIGFDPWNAEGPTQNLERRGIRRTEISQQVAKLTHASKELEKLIVSGGLVHDNNPILDWQIGNCDVHTDTNGNIKPKRPEHGDFRTIDGVAACVMALDRAIRAPRPAKGDLLIC